MTIMSRLPLKFTVCLVAIFLFGIISTLEAATPSRFEIEVGVVIGVNEVDRYRADTLKVADLRLRNRKLGSDSVVGLSCFPDGTDKNFTMFDVMSQGKLTAATKSYGGTEKSSLQSLCLAHHVKYHGR